MSRAVVKHLLALAAILLAVGSAYELSAQKRDSFLHSTSAHKKVDCSSCHKNPTPNWVGVRGYPDVADFPGHTACNSCHSGRQFLTLCSACHTPGSTPKSAPRYPFPGKGNSQEFNTIFPHSVHQDIIASNTRRSDVAVAHFVNASFRQPFNADDPPQFNNCAICHQTTSALPKLAARTPATEKPLADATSDSFVPKPSFFKDMPSGHATCFACHYQGVQPTGTNCAGCHSLTAKHFESNTIKRYSFKFDHQQKEHSVRDCMTCHLRISQNSDVRTMKDADVPFVACVSCHNHAEDVAKEVAKRKENADKGLPAFQCTYCHTTAVGRYPMPASHENR
ncbi:MAG: hypothetical protein QM785_01680 [Pyrinomonadaceae bacterium]